MASLLIFETPHLYQRHICFVYVFDLNIKFCLFIRSLHYLLTFYYLLTYSFPDFFFLFTYLFTYLFAYLHIYLYIVLIYHFQRINFFFLNTKYTESKNLHEFMTKAKPTMCIKCQRKEITRRGKKISYLLFMVQF